MSENNPGKLRFKPFLCTPIPIRKRRKRRLPEVFVAPLVKQWWNLKVALDQVRVEIEAMDMILRNAMPINADDPENDPQPR